MSTAIATKPSTTTKPTPGSRDEHFRQLFDQYYRPVSYFFARRGFSPEECRDLTQETFTNVFKGMGTFRAAASYQGWVFKIAKNLWLNQIRDNAAIKRRVEEVSYEEAFGDGQPTAGWGDSPNPGPEEQLLLGELKTRVRDALERLPRQMRRCLLLRLQGLKYREIADVEGISLQSVRSHLSQGRQRLRELLGEYFSEENLDQVEETT